jgi:two-component system, OmpR family, response regulator
MSLKTILVVDDNALVRQLVCAHLKSEPEYEVCEASDGVEAIEKIAKSKPDLIVLDLVMPRMDGIQLAAALKTSLKNIPVILFTLYDKVASEQKLQLLGIDAIVSKTDPIQNLLEEVQKLVPLTRTASV